MCSQTGSADVRLATSGTRERSLVVVKTVVQLQVNELCEAGLAFVALVGLRTRVQAQVGLQVGR